MKVSEIQKEIDESGCQTAEISVLVPNKKNPRKNAYAAKRLGKAISKIGFGAPIIIQKRTNRVIAGHTRLIAAKELGLKRVPVRILDVDDKRAQAMSLSDNRLGEIAEWDLALLAKQLEEFTLEENDDLGFDAQFLENMAKEIPDFGPIESSENKEFKACENCQKLQEQLNLAFMRIQELESSK
jgi:site-specific DNA-methyltransferase (adenine-specific)